MGHKIEKNIAYCKNVLFIIYLVTDLFIQIGMYFVIYYGLGYILWPTVLEMHEFIIGRKKKHWKFLIDMFILEGTKYSFMLIETLRNAIKFLFGVFSFFFH